MAIDPRVAPIRIEPIVCGAKSLSRSVVIALLYHRTAFAGMLSLLED